MKKSTEQYKATIMIGDGINDSPALASATVGVAMGAPRDRHLDVTKVADDIAIGQKMLRTAKQSIYFGIGASFCLMVIASFGYIQPAVGAILQEVMDTTVILNALRAR